MSPGISATATEKAIQNLPPQLQKKITLVVADISGITYEFCKDMNDMLEKSKDLNGFLQKGADLTLKQTQKISGRTPDVGNNYTFICSQLLMSQLLTIPNLYIQEAVEKKFGSTLSFLGTNAEFFRNNTQLKFALQREHINYLGQSVSNNGTVHLADTYVSKETFQEKPGYLLLDDIINPEIQKFFNPLKETSEWIWRRLPESRFGVKSHALEPIPQKNLRSRR